MAATMAMLSADTLPTMNSHEVHADGRITFRYVDQRAEKVLLNFEGTAQPLPMTRSSDGIWTATTPAQPPQIYYYSFTADGQPRLDPENAQLKPNFIPAYRGNLVTVPGATPQPWEPADRPHGVVHRHTYTTTCVTGLPGNQSEYIVYTPPGYDAMASTVYPVLYLLHGWSDFAVGWIEVGKAHLIMDTLIADHRAVPMVIVMPLGYGEMSFLSFEAWDNPAARAKHYAAFERALLTEVLPQVERGYAVSRQARDRAIAGLSMGGRESLTVGLHHPELFAWVGSFSGSVDQLEADKAMPSPGYHGDALRLVWVACGTDEDGIGPNRQFTTWLKKNNYPVTAIETPGAHTYMVWRENLLAFAPLLFRK